ncbi:MAG: TAXI family TRAP transporter solute-binding subunit [Pararhodobacter sp.]|nr:TAXI family TRAP transporter solute-binding subunit [Pararhodobacter sp.]
MKHLAAIALGACISAGAAQAQQGPVAIGTLPQGSLGYAIAAGIAQVAGEEAGVMLRAVGQGGSSVTIPALNRGEIAFATSNTFEAVFATQGTGNFPDQPNANVRVAAWMQPFMVGVMVPADSDYRSLADLRGAPFATGYARQTLVAVMQDAVFEAHDLSADDFDGVPVSNFTEGARLLAQGDLAAVLLSPGSGVVRQTHAQRPVRFLTVVENDAAADALAAALPGAYPIEVAPSERMPEIADPVTLLGYQYALLTHADADEEMVYQVVRALHESQPALAEAHGSFNGFRPADMATAIEGAEFHPGAIRFYREAGIWPE